MQIKNLFESAYYRRLVLAYLIAERGPISTSELIEIVDWPKNTVKTNISGIKDIGIDVEFIGSRKTGKYQLSSWGPIKKSWVKNNFNEILEALKLFSKKG